ncbi:hypothetical protein F0P96_10565 [Hymenobacter busanensis]|uniref:Uncharacterized protein n=1 Tax=Hymenobacter busanensis TaxID=2607656 RepID=A0A7L4ZY04_9BACT|nr:hypothetical protein [Hymenobacter busanensis]KAA9333403.1 hypothetical protein F0P96_10565 [Hymenobacter busanensis]QHJ07917.1 hypothetical protein GUY19_11740 [Hymenobacter busanensis]
MDTLEHAIERAKAQLQLQAPRVVLTMAQTGLALVVNRLQTEGLKGRRYSTSPLPKFFFRPTNAAGRDYVKRSKKPTYAGLREAQGMETRFVNLTYTGRMLRSLAPVPAGVVASIFQARIVASDAENAAKLEHNRRREGDFLAPNAAEQREVDTYAQRELDRIIQTELNA